MLKSSKTIKDILYVMFSNVISLTSSVINGFILPYILGVTNYGYYRTFILYSTYTALLHCGFVDGILLKYGGIEYNKLNKKKFRTYTSAFIVFQFIVSILLSFSSLFVTNTFYSFLLVVLGVYTFIYNVVTYYMFISQTTMNFGILSVRNTVQYLLFIIFTLFIYFVYKFHVINDINYSTFIYASLVVYIIMFVWYMYTYKKITFGNHYSLIKKGVPYIWCFCKTGIYLTIAYQVSNLIMVIDNQFVSVFFKASTYGKYSFSYSMVSTALTILGAVATVLLPHLKRNTVNHIINVYHKMIASMMLVVYFGLIAYFPVTILIKIILPKYVISLSYLRIFAPELGITCSVTMITFNYYNALNKSRFYFNISIFVLVISIIIDGLLYVISHSPMYIALGSLISVFIWYIISEYYLIKWYHIQWIRNFCYMIIMIVSFLLCSTLSNLIIGFIIYLNIYLFISFIMFKQILYNNLMLLIHTFL